MNITILSVDIKTTPTQKGSYQTADVAYKNNSFQGKVEGKKVMSFGATANAFKTLATATSGESYEVAIVKNDKGYNDWVSMTKATGEAANQPSGLSTAKANLAPKSTYETSEERAAKQVYIVRQSSLSAAVNMLTVGAKSPPKVDDVIATAKQFEDFVFGKKSPGASGFDDLPDFADIPELN